MQPLEVWLMGTPTEVDTALSALDNAGRIEGISPPETMYANDTGRIRRYLRVRIPITATGTGRTTKAAGAAQSSLTLPNAA